MHANKFRKAAILGFPSFKRYDFIFLIKNSTLRNIENYVSCTCKQPITHSCYHFIAGVRSKVALPNNQRTPTQR